MTQWFPIETAPKDGTWILLTGGGIENYNWYGEAGDIPPCVTAMWSSERERWQFTWYDGGYYGHYENPTHWMPLPEAPKP